MTALRCTKEKLAGSIPGALEYPGARRLCYRGTPLSINRYKRQKKGPLRRTSWRRT
jgi:hypothetical protein